MSADTWMDCPICRAKESVRIDYVWDVTKDGKIIHSAKGYCKVCGKDFK